VRILKVLKTFHVATHARTEWIVIDQEIQNIVAESGVHEGVCLVWIPHTTAAVTVNENADPDVVSDILKETAKAIPFDDGYSHAEGNSAAHIKSSLFGPSLTIIISEGSLLLGTWQSIYFSEFDGPRHRTVHVKIQGD
jgi:secondary thiamine-phosphate synthase enzyme